MGEHSIVIPEGVDPPERGLKYLRDYRNTMLVMNYMARGLLELIENGELSDKDVEVYFGVVTESTARIEERANGLMGRPSRIER